MGSSTCRSISQQHIRWHCLSSHLPTSHHEAAGSCSHVDCTVEKPGLQVRIPRMQAHIAKFLAIKCRSPKCCSCTNIMSRLATDCFAAAGRLQYTSFRTNSVDLNDAPLVSIHDWMDAGSRELYIYDQVHMNDPPEMGRHFSHYLGCVSSCWI